MVWKRRKIGNFEQVSLSRRSVSLSVEVISEAESFHTSIKTIHIAQATAQEQAARQLLGDRLHSKDV